MNENELKTIMNEKGLNLKQAESIGDKALVFERALRIIIPPKNQSDMTSFRNITSWIVAECEESRLDENNIFSRVLDFALESSGPGSKNPAAVFMSILKKELGYKK